MKKTKEKFQRIFKGVGNVESGHHSAGMENHCTDLSRGVTFSDF